MMGLNKLDVNVRYYQMLPTCMLITCSVDCLLYIVYNCKHTITIGKNLSEQNDNGMFYEPKNNLKINLDKKINIAM